LSDGKLHLSRLGGLLKEDVSFIKKAREQIVGAQRRRGVERRHEKIEREKETVEIELFLDDLAAEGVDLKSPVGAAIAMRAWALKTGEKLQDEMEREHDDLSY
jgi:hypothetical protein